MTSLHLQAGLQSIVMHLAHLVKQVSVDYVFMAKILFIVWENRQGIIYV